MKHHPVSLHSAFLSIVAEEEAVRYELDCRRNVAAHSQIHASIIPTKALERLNTRT